MWIALVSLPLLGGALGVLLGYASQKLAVEENPLEAEIEELLPGSQCGQCGLAGCKQAASELAAGNVAVTLCPPGGKELALALADKLGVEADLDGMEDHGPAYAFVKEELCIGCTRCAPACSSDAIMGGNKMMHAVFTEVCHGCRKCVAVCPTEAIEMKPIVPTLGTWFWEKPEPLAAGRQSA